MIVKTHFEFNLARAVKIRKMAEQAAREAGVSTDTQRFMDALVERAWQEHEEFLRAQRRQPRQMGQTEKLVADICQRPRGDRVILTGAGDVVGIAAQVRALRPDLELVLR